MPLNSFTPHLVPVRGADGRELGTVRGLSTDDIREIGFSYLSAADELADIFAKIRDSGDAGNALDDDKISEYLWTLVQKAPGLLVSIIARGGDVPPEEEDSIRSMSIGTQFVLLQAVFDQTFAEVGGVKKFVSVVAGMFIRMLPEPEKSSSETTEKTKD